VRPGARFAFVMLLLAAGAGACNAITGANERKLDPNLDLDERDTGGGKDEDTGANAPLDASIVDTSVPDAKADTSTQIVVDVTGSWTSPNGGTPMVVANGVKIVAMDASAANNHPVIVPSPQPSIPSDDYTVRATVLTPNSGTPEFGIMTRIQPDGSGIVLGNVYGAAPPAFIGRMEATGTSRWNPSKDGAGPTYTYAAGARYKVVVRVVGSQVYGKFWMVPDSEPPGDQMAYLTSPWTTGKGVGFYTYYPQDVVLEEMTITVP
jgi:hypothetical protein